MDDECFLKALEVMKACSTSNGLYASGGRGGYDAVWARDSMISCIGASAAKDPRIREVFRRSLETLASHQAPTGQIPNAVDRWSGRKPHTDFASVDSSLWYVIGNHTYRKRYGDASLIRKRSGSVERAMQWLRCQEAGENGLITQLPTTDWQDAFPHKYGHTISTQALYFMALTMSGERKRAEKVKRMVNGNRDTMLWEGDYYIAYRWKNHGKYREAGEWFDSLGNLLAIISGMAERGKAVRILRYIEKNGVDRPYPVRSIFPPIRMKSRHWHDYFRDCDAGKPHHYLNGGIWPFIGGFYVLALIKAKKTGKAREMIGSLEKANLDGNFPEWINPMTGKARGRLQAWDAGTYILAKKSLERKCCLL